MSGSRSARWQRMMAERTARQPASERIERWRGGWWRRSRRSVAQAASAIERGATLPSGRGGEMPHALSDDEGVAAEGDRDVMVPAREAASLEVVEAQLALHLLVDALGAVALLEQADDLLLAHRASQGRERELASAPSRPRAIRRSATAGSREAGSVPSSCATLTRAEVRSASAACRACRASCRRAR